MPSILDQMTSALDLISSAFGHRPTTTNDTSTNAEQIPIKTNQMSTNAAPSPPTTFDTDPQPDDFPCVMNQRRSKVGAIGTESNETTSLTDARTT